MASFVDVLKATITASRKIPTTSAPARASDPKVPLSTSIANLEYFFDSCPITPIHFVYFTCSNRKCTPHIKSFFHEWVVGNKTVYSTLMTDGWSYTYGLTALQLLMYVDKSGVVAFEKAATGAPIQRGNKSIIPRTPKQTQVTVTIGDHITIGISYSKDPNDPLISTHKTSYTLMNTPQVQYERDEIKCNITLYAQPIDATCNCQKPNTNMGTQYANEPLAIPIIQKITDVYKGIVTGGAYKTRRKQKHIYKGIKYIVHDGQVGETRKYIGGSLKLTYKGTGYDDNGFIDFLYKYILSVVASRETGMENITIIYDEESYINTDTNRYICIIYEYTVYEEEERASIYYIDALKAFTAYYAYITPAEKTTSYEKTCFQEFQEDIMQHIPQVVVV